MASALSVALACGDDRPGLSDAAAVALELIHSASLVHDDLPAFDDADIRRGKPTVHKAFSEPLAVLAGDSLIVLAFEVLARAAGDQPVRALRLVQALAQRTGMPMGICAGQAWESEAQVNLGAYHRAKTGALFIAATQMGAHIARVSGPSTGLSASTSSMLIAWRYCALGLSAPWAWFFELTAASCRAVVP